MRTFKYLETKAFYGKMNLHYSVKANVAEVSFKDQNLAGQ